MRLDIIEVRYKCDYQAKYAVPFLEFTFTDGGLKLVGDSRIVGSKDVNSNRALFLDYINTFIYAPTGG